MKNWMQSFNTLMLALLSIICLVAGQPAQAHDIIVGKLVISHVWAKSSLAGSDATAGYLRIENKGTEDDRLLSASTEISQVTQLHSMEMEGNVMKMKELPNGLAIPAGKTVELKPKSYHIM